MKYSSGGQQYRFTVLFEVSFPLNDSIFLKALTFLVSYITLTVCTVTVVAILEISLFKQLLYNCTSELPTGDVFKGSFQSCTHTLVGFLGNKSGC